MTEPSNPLTDVLDALMKRGLVRDAQEFDRHIGRLASSDPTERANAAEGIADMCQMKWLGDLDVDRRDWWQLLDQARTFARKEAKGPHPKART